MKTRFTSLGQVLLVVTVFAGASCQGEDFATEDDSELQFGVLLAGLGTDVASCTAANPTTGFVKATRVLNLALLTNTDAVLSVVGGQLTLNGRPCRTSAIVANASVAPPVVGVPAIDLTSTNVSKINIAVAGTSKVVFDLLPGTFGTIFNGTGGIVVSAATGGLSIGVRGTAATNVFKMGQEGTGAAGPFYLELSGDTRADVRINGNPAAVSMALGDGADSFTAQGQALTTTALGGTAATGSVVAEPLSVFGGAGNDTLKGGLGSDTLDGGDGNDVFTTSLGNVNDGADVYIGGAGNDLVNYSGRTTALDVSIAPTYDNGWVEGVNLTNLSVPANALLNYQAGTDPPAVFTFPATPTVGASAIMRVLSGDIPVGSDEVSGGLVGAAVGVDDRGNVFIKKKGAVGAIAVSAGGSGLFSSDRSNDGTTQLRTDPDDGQAGELDDVRADVENITGGSGNDTLSGSIGSNTINGGAGDDILSGGSGGEVCAADVDVLNGAEGNDFFQMGSAFNCGDAVDGGSGSDTVSYELRSDSVSVALNALADDGQASELDKIKVGVEVILGGQANDSLIGGTGAEELHGGPGDDLITGGAGADTLVGGPGFDTLLGGAGKDVFNERDVVDTAFVTPWLASVPLESDVLNGGPDFDTADYGRTSATTMTVSLCAAPNNTTSAGVCTGEQDAPNNDTTDGDDISNCEQFIGGAGADVISGSTVADLIDGRDGNDSIMGGGGNDTLFGGAGTDTLDGGGVSAGLNVLSGGSGSADICAVGAAGTVDTSCEL